MKLSIFLVAAFAVGETWAFGNPDNPLDFCGRMSTSTGRFDPYYKKAVEEEEALELAQADHTGPYMVVKQPGDTVTVGGVTGILDDDCNLITPNTSGDPHFATWGGEKYDFHGGCDLVLLQSESYANGLGLNIHIRTKINTWWSYIESAVIQLGEHTLEVTSQDGGLYWLNGEKESHKVENGDATLGDYGVHFRRVNDHQTQIRIDLGDGNAAAIETFKKFTRVNVVPRSIDGFNGSTGMLGSYPGGQRVARDGATVIEDTNEFGQEWMVRPSDPILFHDVDTAEFPLKCTMPDVEAKQEARRRLGEMITEEDAASACARVNPADRDACIFDVLATNDKDMAGSY